MDAGFRSRLLVLNDFLHEASRASHLGVTGVFLRDSGLPGPRVGITTCTHGNEIAGLEAVSRLLMDGTFDKLTSGSVLVAVNNLLATETFLAMALMEMSPDFGTMVARFVHLNMNRLPDELLTIPPKYEVLRANELLRVWQTFDHAIDLHSVHAPNIQPFIISTMPELDPGLMMGIPGEDIITNITKNQIGRPACHFYGLGQCKSLALEAGQHYDEEAVNVAYASAVQFCRNAGVLPSQAVKPHERTVWRVMASVIPTSAEFTLIRPLMEHESLERGQILTYPLDINGRQETLRAPCDGYVILAPPPDHLKPQKLGEEWFFIADSPQHATI